MLYHEYPGQVYMSNDLIRLTDDLKGDLQTKFRKAPETLFALEEGK